MTGASGSGKTTLVLDTLVPALEAHVAGARLPAHVAGLDADGLRAVHRVDATPIGVNVRSTVATYSGVLDDLRRAFAATDAAAARGLAMGAFSYNTGSLRCPRCDGTGRVELGVQFLADIDIECPDCGGGRFGPDAAEIRRPVAGTDRAVSLPELMRASVAEAIGLAGDIRSVARKLGALADLGLGYLRLGEATPALSGGEAQRLKLAGQVGRRQEGVLFVFDEPSVGLHPLDVRALVAVLDRLVAAGATVVVIEHDLDMIANADHVIDMGPGGGEAGGRVVAAGTPRQVADDPASVTGAYLRDRVGG